MTALRNLFFTLSLLLFANTVYAGPKLVKIKLTGTCYEDVEMTVGKTGRTEIISSLPFFFQISKEDLPVNLTFRSANYTYTPITVPTKPSDPEIGHVYLLKRDENNFAQQVVSSTPAPATNTPNPPTAIKGIDTTHGINAAPYTGLKSEKTYALIIANEEYEEASNVAMANNDGLAIKHYCEKTLGIPKNQIVYRSNATFAQMRKAINEIKGAAAANEGDINLIVYYAGHGIPDNASKDAFLMPVDADGTDTEVCYSLKRFYNDIDAMHVNQAVVFLDACFSGAKRDGDMIIAARGVAIKPKEEKPSANGSTIVISATSDEQTAYSYEEEKHGLFTYFLLKAMQEKKGKMNLGELTDYICENVSKQSISINGASKKQTPTVIIPTTMDDWKKRKLTDK